MRKLGMDPLRRFTFDQLSDLARGDRRLCQYENVNVIVEPADHNSRHIMVLQYTADVRPNPLLDVGRDELHSPFCAEDEMVKALGICVCHSVVRR